MTNQQLEQNKTETQMSYPAKVAIIGFFGGLIWSLIGYFSFFFHFIRVGPALALMPFALGPWKDTYIGQLVGVVVISVLSIGVAFVYKLLLQKHHNLWVSVLFGVVLWGIVFYLLNPIFPGLKTIQTLDANSIMTSLSLYIMYGVFIGYSISYEFQQQHQDK